MKVIASKPAKNRLPELIKNLSAESVTITKNGKPVAALIAIEEYERLKQIDKCFWGELANIAKKMGFVDSEEINKWVEEKFIAAIK